MSAISLISLLLSFLIGLNAANSNTHNNAFCADSTGNIFFRVPGRADLFEFNGVYIACRRGAFFDVETCTCAGEEGVEDEDFDEVQRARDDSRQCHLWLPFDDTLQDESVNHFETQTYGKALLDPTISAVGGGSLLLNTGRLEVPDMANIDMGTQATWCLFFRCESFPPTGRYSCLKRGGLLSNNLDKHMKHFHFVAAVPGNDSLSIHMKTTVNYDSPANGPVNIPKPDWNHACAVYNGTSVNLYVNGIRTTSAPATGHLVGIDAPYVIGADLHYGEFMGHVDDVLVCKTALSHDEVQAHFKGDRDALRDADLIP